MNLKPRSIILLALDAFGGSVGGKTLLQKRLYFVELVLGTKLGLEFGAHFYGPYSAVVNSELGTLKVQGQVREESANYGVFDESGFELRRFHYSLTDAGRESVKWLSENYPTDSKAVQDAARKITEAGDLDYLELSFSAKAHWILQDSVEPLSPEEMSRQAQSFGWKVTPHQFENGVAFLEKLGLVRCTES